MGKKKLLQILLFLIPGMFVIIFLLVFYAHAGKTGGVVKHYVSEEEANREIIFDGDRIFTTKASYVKVSGNKVTITRSGTYIIKGRLDDGQIVVDVGDEDVVKLKMNDCKVTCSYGPPIYVINAKKLQLRLKDGSENELIHLENEKAEENNDGEDMAKACIYARSDLTIKGDGSLTVEGLHRHGIFSSKDLRIKGGNIKVTAAKQALHGKKTVLIENGDLSLKAGTDGIHSNGSLEITGGQVEIDAGKYAMYAYTRLFVDKSKAVVNVIHALSEAGCQGELEY